MLGAGGAGAQSARLLLAELMRERRWRATPIANIDDSIQTIHDLIEETATMEIAPGGKSLVILRLAEAAAWLINPNQPHGGSVEVSSSN